MIIIGDEEEKNNTFSIRGHGGKDFGVKNISEIIKFISKMVTETIKDF